MNCIKCKVYLTEEEERQYKNHCKVCYRKENGLCVKCGKILDKFQLVNGYYKCFSCYKRYKEIQQLYDLP